MDMVLIGCCEQLWVFGETITAGMQAEINKANKKEIKIEYIKQNPVSAILLDMSLGKKVISLTAINDLISCAIGDDTVDGKPYSDIVEIARKYIHDLGGFEKFAEWGLIR